MEELQFPVLLGSFPFSKTDIALVNIYLYYRLPLSVCLLCPSGDPESPALTLHFTPFYSIFNPFLIHFYSILLHFYSIFNPFLLLLSRMSVHIIVTPSLLVSSPTVCDIFFVPLYYKEFKFPSEPALIYHQRYFQFISPQTCQ